ncbi:hypothetical protein CEXT_727601 [Caerostris extrusa]|uniref:Uncharacterized protein n=1 Tax=Caerostris extrusa TaxID=172846 RepID=A0AAV4PKY8_CAEEX|nr:hypothetical protein CEXT_727601 [Caerostris extrusa]
MGRHSYPCQSCSTIHAPAIHAHVIHSCPCDSCHAINAPAIPARANSSTATPAPPLIPRLFPPQSFMPLLSMLLHAPAIPARSNRARDNHAWSIQALLFLPEPIPVWPFPHTKNLTCTCDNCHLSLVQIHFEINEFKFYSGSRPSP